MRLKASILIALAFSPVLASARPRPTKPRMHSQVIRNRTPKAHLHIPQARQR
ncbi:hypothetical protein [Edaphobacter aggregans]|uniref:hypothetical protein n=1 Tax=Edaphobacter aggregans TaxID=570835 RepID=UPI0012F86277|nr:hypothetical protein [Edaphobacter aggregans]